MPTVEYESASFSNETPSTSYAPVQLSKSPEKSKGGKSRSSLQQNDNLSIAETLLCEH